MGSLQVARDASLDQQQEQGEALPENIKNMIETLAKKVNKRELYPRLNEIRQATEQRFFYKGEQHGFWNMDQGIYQVGLTGGGFNAGNYATKQPTFRKAFNIYLGYAKSFMAVFSQAVPTTRFEPENPKDSGDIEAAKQATKMARVIDKYNDPATLQTEIGRLLWTDSRCVSYTRWVEDGQRFGYQDDAPVTEVTDDSAQSARIPKGQEVVEVFGTLETKVPLIARGDGIGEWDFCKISTEHSVSQMKAIYPDKQIARGGYGYDTIEEMARMARIGTCEGARWIAEDSIAYLCTRDRYWFRPSLYSELEDADRDQLAAMFPSGIHAVFVGKTLCEARNECMDDHIDVIHGLPDAAQGRISLGSPMIPIQKEFNDWMNMISEAGKYAIPATWINQEAVDIDAMEEQDSEYGAHWPCEKPPGEALANNFFVEPAVEFPPAFIQFVETLQGPLAQFITGQQPALFGGEMSDQKTARGYAMAREQAMGLMALIWVPFKQFRSRYMRQAVQISAKERVQNSLSARVPMMGRPGKQEDIDVNLQDLKGNVLCFPETDENFPESWTQQSNKLMQLIQFLGQDPVFLQLLQEPDNQALMHNKMGLEDFVIPGADSRDKQLQEIAFMRDNPPVPDMGAIQQEMQEAQMGAPLVMDPSTMPMQSSVPVDPDFDNHQAEFETCNRWINGCEGQKAKNSQDPMQQEWYQNVRLHALEHRAIMQQQMAQQMMMQAAMQPPPAAPPGKNGKGSLPSAKPNKPEGNSPPQTTGPVENPNPLV